MNSLHGKYMKIVAAGGDLDGASELDLAKGAVSIKLNGVLVLQEGSENPNPTERREIGTTIEVKGVLEFATRTEAHQIIGGTNSASVHTKTQSIRTLPKYDIRIATHRADDTLLDLHDCTNMNLIPDLEKSFEQGSQFYLPVMGMSTKTSTYSDDYSAT